MLSKRDLLKERGWTESLVCKLLPSPDEIRRRKPYGKTYLYDEDRVKEAEQAPSFLAWQEKKANPPPPRKCKTLGERFPNWRDALPGAAEAMFSLNRYAKYNSCTLDNRSEIYRLKNGLIQVLYSIGAAEQVHKHVVPMPMQRCRACEGADTWDSWQSDELGKCERCNGTGIYLEACNLVFVVFRFQVGDQAYSWHQPEDLLAFNPKFTANAEISGMSVEERPLKMDIRKFADAKRLVGFVVDSWRAERAASSGPDHNGEVLVHAGSGAAR